jgi:uncharacterized protein (TIGR03435 family)
MNMASPSSHLAFQVCISLAGFHAMAQPPKQPLVFEVASVKPSDPASRATNVLTGVGDSLTITNVPLRKIIMYAYDIRDFQLLDIPGWVEVERYDIVAKSAKGDGAASEATAETDDQRKDRAARIRERLRSLLADRFDLQVHMEQRERTVLDLRIAKGGPKLTEAARKTGTISTTDGRIQGFGVRIPMLVTQLSIATGLIVHDETGLSGVYDFLLEFAPDEKNQQDTHPSIFTAVVEQLGLRLEKAKGPVQSVVIDHIERPSAN